MLCTALVPPPHRRPASDLGHRGDNKSLVPQVLFIGPLRVAAHPATGGGIRESGRRIPVPVHNAEAVVQDLTAGTSGNTDSLGGLMLRSRVVRLGATLLLMLGLVLACIPTPQVSDPKVRNSIRTCWNASPQVWLTFDDYGSPAQVNR